MINTGSDFIFGLNHLESAIHQISECSLALAFGWFRARDDVNNVNMNTYILVHITNK